MVFVGLWFGAAVDGRPIDPSHTRPCHPPRLLQHNLADPRPVGRAAVHPRPLHIPPLWGLYRLAFVEEEGGGGGRGSGSGLVLVVVVVDCDEGRRCLRRRFLLLEEGGDFLGAVAAAALG